nr:MAG: movement protein [Tomato vitivirus 1]
MHTSGGIGDHNEPYTIPTTRSRMIESGQSSGAISGSKRFGKPENTSNLGAKVFDVKQGTEDVGSLKKQLSRNKVYDLKFFESLFPTQVFKSVVHEEIRVVDGEIDVDINLVNPELVEHLDPVDKPYVHVGCVAVAVIPHGRGAPGHCEFELIDTRYTSNHGVLAKFGCKMSSSLSAFARFPGYFISTHDIKDGYTLGLRVQGKALELHDGVRPLSVQIISIIKVCGEEFKHRYALAKLPVNAYQNLLNAYLISEDDQTDYKIEDAQIKRGKMVEPNAKGDTLVMSEVYETIKKLYPEHGGYIQEEPDQKGRDNPVGGRGEVRG